MMLYLIEFPNDERESLTLPANDRHDVWHKLAHHDGVSWDTVEAAIERGNITITSVIRPLSIDEMEEYFPQVQERMACGGEMVARLVHTVNLLRQKSDRKV